MPAVSSSTGANQRSGRPKAPIRVTWLTRSQRCRLTGTPAAENRAASAAVLRSGSTSASLLPAAGCRRGADKAVLRPFSAVPRAAVDEHRHGPAASRRRAGRAVDVMPLPRQRQCAMQRQAPICSGSCRTKPDCLSSSFRARWVRGDRTSPGANAVGGAAALALEAATHLARIVSGAVGSGKPLACAGGGPVRVVGTLACLDLVGQPNSACFKRSQFAL